MSDDLQRFRPVYLGLMVPDKDGVWVDRRQVATMVAEARNAALEEAAAYCEAVEMGISPKAGGKYTPHPSTCFEVGSGTHAGMGYAAMIRAIKDAPNA